jgi:hypothetical protein
MAMPSLVSANVARMDACPSAANRAVIDGSGAAPTKPGRATSEKRRAIRQSPPVVLSRTREE